MALNALSYFAPTGYGGSDVSYWPQNHKAFKEAQEGFSELNNFVQESVSGVKVTKSFGFQADEIQAFEKPIKWSFQNMTSAGYNALFDSDYSSFVGLSYVLTLYFGGLFVQEGSLTVGQIVTFITYLNMPRLAPSSYGLLV